MFSNFSEVQYTLGTGKIVTIKDFFKKASVEQESLWGVVDYTFYQLEDGERPDIVANKLYGDSDLHWTLFLVNDFATYGDWHKDSITLENHMSNKYKETSLGGLAVGETQSEMFRVLDDIKEHQIQMSLVISRMWI